MSEKKCLVVYYSRTGTTRKVAEAIAAALACDIEEIVDTKDRKGAAGFAVAIKDSALKKLADIEEPKNDPGRYDLVVVGTPMWAWTMSTPIRTWLTRQAGRLPQVAFFLTSGGSDPEGTFRDMAALAGKEPVAALSLKDRRVRKGEWAEPLREFVEKLR